MPFRGSGIVPQQVQEIIDAVSDTIAAEIQRSLDFYMATSGESEIHHIHVTGGTASLTTLRNAIQRRAKAPVDFFNPTEKLAMDSHSQLANVLTPHAAQFSVAIGLALRKEKEKRA